MQRRFRRSLRAAVSGAILLALAASPALAADPAKAELPAAPSAKVSTTAKILIATNVFTQPGKRIKLRLPTHASWGGGPHVLLVLDSRMYKHKAWLRVALPDRPKQRSFEAVIGKPATPTPGGLYAIYEKLPQPDPKGFLGPWALHLTAFSDVIFNYGGGPGRVAIHGRDGTSLADPLGSSASHGCVRVDDANIIWMARVIPLGTPVLII